MSCVTSVSFSILLNGSPDRKFQPHRGLRQGDPLSPYLFILCAEVFSAMIQQALVNNSIRGIRITPRAPTISHLLFADDNVIFARETIQEATAIIHILHTYESISSQKINLEKSELSWSQGVPSTRVHELQQLLGMKAVESHPKYLGLPNIVGRSKSQVFAFVRDRV